MNKNRFRVLRESQRRPLSACIATLFALSATQTIANTVVVTSCDDGATASTTPGTLRYAALNATSPAVIDMTGLKGANACPNSTLSLLTGQIPLTQSDVTINGPGSANLAVDATYLPTYGIYRVFGHGGSGMFTVNNLTVSHGHVEGTGPYVIGGCIYSAGIVTINNSVVTSCTAESDGSYPAIGGGVYARFFMTLSNTIVTKSKAIAFSQPASGGGVYTKEHVRLYSASSITGNVASSSGSKARGGGIFAVDLSGIYQGSTVSGNTATGNQAFGGGVYEKGDVSVDNASITYNYANASGIANGGGAYVGGYLELSLSRLNHNRANSAAGAYGGGARAGRIYAGYSTIDSNSASGYGFGGGVYSNGSVILYGATVSNNFASHSVGGIDSLGGDIPNKTTKFTISTISGNSAGGLMGGVYTDAGTVAVYNSTIAFNTATSEAGTPPYIFAPGLAIHTGAGTKTILVESSILSQNTIGSAEDDLSTTPGLPDIAGSYNLIRAAKASIAFDASKCPLLGPLRNNGGLTQTHALASGSPAIDAGYNATLLLTYDQRGSASINGTRDYARDYGMTDIGAYEVQKNDIVFSNFFETCQLLL